MKSKVIPSMKCHWMDEFIMYAVYINKLHVRFDCLFILRYSLFFSLLNWSTHAYRSRNIYKEIFISIHDMDLMLTMLSLYCETFLSSHHNFIINNCVMNKTCCLLSCSTLIPLSFDVSSDKVLC